jgi:hypothetical protein
MTMRSNLSAINKSRFDAADDVRTGNTGLGMWDKRTERKAPASLQGWMKKIGGSPSGSNDQVKVAMESIGGLFLGACRPQIFNRHPQQMLDTIFVRAFQRLYGLHESEGLFNGVQGGFLIRVWHGFSVSLLTHHNTVGKNSGV